MFWFDVKLYKMPRYKKVTPKTIKKLDLYFAWEKEVASGLCDYTFKTMTGITNAPPRELIDFYRPFYGDRGILVSVANWNRYEHIHSWFVKNVQDGIDDSYYHQEVTKEKLEQLLKTCKRVLDSCEVVKQEKIIFKRPYTCTIGDKTYTVKYHSYLFLMPEDESKYVIHDTSVAKKLLPLKEGLFGANYGDNYVKGLIETIEVVERVLRETNFETEAIYYIG